MKKIRRRRSSEMSSAAASLYATESSQIMPDIKWTKDNENNELERSTGHKRGKAAPSHHPCVNSTPEYGTANTITLATHGSKRAQRLGIPS